ncbi:hypothetical protein K1719_045726 [Acacia pycnantha]|nr:hypothetical protein K1719_045726 [Acacia pycnantha]
MTMDKEKEREIELESAMYTNCLMLGLDPAIIGVGASNGTPRVRLFAIPTLNWGNNSYTSYSLPPGAQFNPLKQHFKSASATDMAALWTLEGVCVKQDSS